VLHRLVLSALGAVLVTLPAAGLASTSTTKAPIVRIWAGLTSTNMGRKPVSEQADWVMIRTGAPKTDVASWLPSTDPAFALMKRDPKLFAKARVSIRFGENGLPEYCNIVDAQGAGILTEKLCDRIRPSARLVPALTRSGETQWDVLQLTVTFNPDAEPAAPPPIILVPPPVPALPSDFSSFVSASGLALFTPGPDAIPADAPTAQVVVEVKSGRALRCTVSMWWRQHKELDDRACGYALQATYGDRSYNARALPILFVGNELKALLPTSHRFARPQLKDDAPAKLARTASNLGGTLDPVEANLAVGPDGRATDCWLSRGSGSDRADLAICDQLLGEALFVPGRDLFGVPKGDSFYGLTLAKSAK